MVINVKLIVVSCISSKESLSEDFNVLREFNLNLRRIQGVLLSSIWKIVWKATKMIDLIY